MARSKFLFIAVIVLVLGALAVALYAWFFGESLRPLIGTDTEAPVVVTTEYEAGEVTVVGRPDSHDVRLALREELADLPADVAVPESVDDVNVETDIENPGGGISIGDGLISRSPQVGYIYACATAFNGGGAHATGEWIDDGYWYPESKVRVDGAQLWNNEVAISLSQGIRTISTNGLPNHTTGNFPIVVSDDAYQYDRNPNAISQQSVTLEVPQYPALAAVASCVPLGHIGIAVNGVALYNGLDGQGFDAPAHEVQDSCAGHPERTGEYHYHNESGCLLDTIPQNSESTLVGYALDGFGIFSSVEYGEKLTNSDLDACHGHTHSIAWDGSTSNLYHYHMTDEYPYSVGCFMGTPQSVVASAASTQTQPAPPPKDAVPPAGTPPPPEQSETQPPQGAGQPPVQN